MDAARWERIQALFHEALARPAAQRSAFLEAACEGDSELAADVRALLAADAEHDSPLDGGLADLARDVLGGSVPLLRQVGPYRVQRVLGRGGMGVVYLAEREDLGRQAAIKVLRDASLSPARRARFTREEQTLAQLIHPSIAQLYDADALPDGTPYFIMEYVEGAPLTEYCDARGCTLAERLRLFRAACEAVQYAHRQAVVHRDLKPSNIFVNKDGQVKLLDFGIAKPLEALDAPADQPQAALRLMTPAYAAPEQLRGEAVGVYTDVYALGVLLYELLTGRHPHALDGKTPRLVEQTLLEQEPEKPSAAARRAGSAAPFPALSRNAWADLDALCLTVMHKDPQHRYATVEALLRDLDRFQEGKPLEVRPGALGYRLGKFLRRHRQPLAAAALAAAVLIGVATFYTVQLAEQRDRAQAEAQKAEQVSDYLIGLFKAGDPFSPGADSLDVDGLLERGAARAAALSEQPGVRAQMLDALGQVYLQLSQYDRADSLLRQALALRRGLRDAPLDVAETLVNRAELYKLKGRYDSAEVSVREALALQEEQLPPNHPDLASTLHDLGSILNSRGHHEVSEVYHRLALRIQRAVYDAPHETLAITLNDLAVCLFEQGRYDAAERYFREAIAVDRAVFGPDHVSTAIDLANLGAILDTRGHYAAADSMLTEALRIKRRALGADHYETAFAITQLGGMLRRKGDYDRAERLLREALEIEERIFDGEHRNTGFTLNHLALALQDQQDLAAAEPMLRRAVSIFETTVGADHPFTGTVRCHLAHLLHLRERDEAAEALFRQCLATLRAGLPADHDLIAMNESKLGALLSEQARYAEAESLLTRGYERLDAKLGADHEYTQAAARRLVAHYTAQGKPAEAAPFRAVLAEANAAP